MSNAEDDVNTRDSSAKLLGLRPIRRRTFGIYSIRMLNEGCIPNAERMFDMVETTPVNTIYKTRPGFPKTHYTIKPYFYDFADFMISRMPQRGDPLGFKRSIRFKVRLVNPVGKPVQGSLSFADLGIHSPKDLDIWERILGDFTHTKHTLEPMRNASEANNQVPNQISEIANRMSIVFKDNIKHAMTREVIEECAPPNDGRSEYLIAEDVYASLRLKRAYIEPLQNKHYIEHDGGYIVRTDRNGTKSLQRVPFEWKYNIYFDFISRVPYTKQRELDTVCANINGHKTLLHYIYPGNTPGALQRYSTLQPYLAVDTRDDARLLERHWELMARNNNSSSNNNSASTSSNTRKRSRNGKKGATTQKVNSKEKRSPTEK